jgi:SnoaL-like polyketide cyclase
MNRMFKTVFTALLATLLTVSFVNAQDPELSEQEQTHLETFDDLDFNVFTGQKWDELQNSHAQNIIVHWPDGHITEGIDVHIEDLKAMFVYAPDTRVSEHPIRIASGDYTAVTGVFEGTFTEPMPLRWYDDCAHWQSLRSPDGHVWALGKWRDG